MSDLQSLFPIGNFASTSAPGAFTQVYVYNTGLDSLSNGGQCCLWTVPADTSWVRFETWGGGSSGGGSCCCQQPRQSGGAGAYARRTVAATPGQTYTVCGAGSTACSPTCCGTEGYPSFVNGGASAGAVALCAAGGPAGCTGCFMYGGCTYTGNTHTCRSGSYCGEDFGLPAISGASQQGTCGYQGWQYVPSGPYIGGGVRHGIDYCQSLSGCASIGGYASFPGGGGGGAQANGGGCCYGSHGAGGLVIITYR
jgi:hypothetical protein